MLHVDSFGRKRKFRQPYRCRRFTCWF